MRFCKDLATENKLLLNNYNLYQNYFLQTLLDTKKDSPVNKVNVKLYKRLVLDLEFFNFLKTKYLKDETSKEEKQKKESKKLRTSRVLSKSPNPIKPLDYGHFNKKLKCRRFKCFSPKIKKLTMASNKKNRPISLFTINKMKKKLKKEKERIQSSVHSSDKSDNVLFQTVSCRRATRKTIMPYFANLPMQKKRKRNSSFYSSSSEEEDGSLTRKAFLIKRNAPKVPLPAFTKTATERACVNRREQRQNFFISKLVRHNGTVSKRKDSSKRRLDKLSISSSDSGEDEHPLEQEPSNETARINLSLVSNDLMRQKKAVTSPKNMSSFRYYNSDARRKKPNITSFRAK